MTAKILDGKQTAEQLLQQIAAEVKTLQMPPILTTILVGDDTASKLYIKKKQLAAEKTGIAFQKNELSQNTTEKELLDLIQKYNQNKNIHGILVQLPLPDHIESQKIIEAIDPLKDIDGFHPINLGLLAQKHPRFIPCTALGILELLKQTNISLKGKDVVVVGASMITGLPTALTLLSQNCTITICHEFTKNLLDKIKQADILIAALGKPNFIQADWIKEDAIVIDVGINLLPDNTITGDVDFKNAYKKAGFITPVPNGVGPMTVAMLLKNTIKAVKLQKL